MKMIGLRFRVIGVVLLLAAYGSIFFFPARPWQEETYLELTARNYWREYLSLSSAGAEAVELKTFRPLGPVGSGGHVIPRGKAKNVIVWWIETAPAFGFENLSPERIPVISEMSQNAFVSRHHYTTSLESQTALYSLLTSNLPFTTARHAMMQSASHPIEAFKKNGYRLGLFTAYPYGNDPVIFLLKNHYRFDSVFTPKTFLRPIYPNRIDEDREMVDRALSWIPKNGGPPFFLILNPQNTHAPFWSPKTDGEPSGEAGSFLRFRNAVQYQDKLLGRLIEGLKRRGVYDDTLIVVTGDHGWRALPGGVTEDLSESANRCQFCDFNIRVPLIIHNPRMFSSRLVASSVSSHIDLLPTIAELVGVRLSTTTVDGKSILQDQRPLHSVVAVGFNWDKVAFVSSNEKYIFDFISMRGAYLRNPFGLSWKPVATPGASSSAEWKARALRWSAWRRSNIRKLVREEPMGPSFLP
jgi:membrane-anchored protein YejM (alkaline phosphatase superfamily)